jgi:hypothetical protein
MELGGDVAEATEEKVGEQWVLTPFSSRDLSQTIWRRLS